MADVTTPATPNPLPAATSAVDARTCWQHSGQRPVRSTAWLRRELDRIWATHFADLARVNEVEIAFGPSWKYRLGMIALSESHRRTYIGLNGIFRSRLVPECVPVITIAHELVHYSHGFGSPLPRLHRDPHANDIVLKDLVRRGFDHELSLYEEWTTSHWFTVYENHRLLRQRRARRAQRGLR